MVCLWLCYANAKFIYVFRYQHRHRHHHHVSIKMPVMSTWMFSYILFLCFFIKEKASPLKRDKKVYQNIKLVQCSSENTALHCDCFFLFTIFFLGQLEQHYLWRLKLPFSFTFHFMSLYFSLYFFMAWGFFVQREKKDLRHVRQSAYFAYIMHSDEMTMHDTHHRHCYYQCFYQPLEQPGITEHRKISALHKKSNKRVNWMQPSSHYQCKVIC